MSLNRAFFVLLVALALLAVAASAASTPSFGCEDYWSGPSANNDPEASGFCGWEKDYMDKSKDFVGAGFAVAMILIWALTFPIIFMCFVCCQCCDCCETLEPGEPRKLAQDSRCCLAVVAFAVIALGITVLVLLFLGAASVQTGVDGVFTNVEDSTIGFFEDLITDLKDALRIDNDTYVDPVTNDTFTPIEDVISNVRGVVVDYRSDVNKYSNDIAIVGYCIAAFPLIMLAFIVIFSVCNCRTCLPACCSCIYFFIGIIFALIAVVLLILAVILTKSCGEVERLHNNEPGLILWYAVPKCEEAADFDSIKSNVRDAERENAVKFCEELIDYCDPNPNYSGSGTVFFVCDMTDANESCKSFDNASRVVNNTYMKVGAPVCTYNCTLRECPDNCSDTDLQDNVRDALDILSLAQKGFRAFAILEPVLDCSYLFKKFMLSFATAPKVRDGTWYVGVGFFLSVVAFYIGAILLLRGSKIWYSDDELKDEADETEMQK